MTTARERVLQTKLYKIVMWITFFSMGSSSLLFLPNLFKRVSGRPGLASVNGVDISLGQFQAQVAHEYERIALLQQQLGEHAELLLKAWGLDNPNQRALEELVQQTLLNQIADALHIRIAPSFLMQKLQDPSYVVNNLRSIVPLSVLEQNGTINFALLRNHVARLGLTLGDFEHAVEQALRRNLVLGLIESAAYVTAEEIKQYFIEQYLPKKYTILTFPLEKYRKEVKAQPTADAVLKEFFTEANAKTKQYWVPEKRSAKIWSFKPNQYGITNADTEIERYYQEHKQQYLEKPAAMRIRRILFKGTDGADVKAIQEKARTVAQEAKEHPEQFETLARTHSDDAQSAAKGGLLEFFSRGQKDPALERAAFRLQEDGAIADLFMSDDGIELIQRVARKPATYKTLANVRADIEKKLLKQKFAERFSADVQPLLDQLAQNPALLDELVRKKQAQNSTIEPKELDDSALMKKLFKTPQGQWAFVIDADGNGIIINTISVAKKHEPAFDTVKLKIIDDYYHELAQKRLAQALDTAKVAAGTQDIAAVQKSFEAKSQTTDWLTKSDKEHWQELEKKGLPVTQLFALTEKNPVAIEQDEQQGYVVKLVASKPFDEAQLQDKQQEIKQILYQEQQELIKRGYIASLYRNATIKTMKDSEFPQDSELPLEEPI